MTDLPEKGVGRPDPMAFGRGLEAGVGVNILVRDVEASIRWQVEVLQATETGPEELRVSKSPVA